MTTTTPTSTTTSFRSAGTPARHRRWIAISAGALALAGATTAVVAFEDSDTDRPLVESVVPVDGPVADGTATAGDRVSADAADRRALIGTVASCSSLSADAAERCMAAGR